MNDNRSRNSNFWSSQIFKSSSRIALIVGFLIGAFEGLRIAFHVLSNNSPQYLILTDLVKIASIGIFIYMLFMLAINSLMLPILCAFWGKLSSQSEESNPECWFWRFNYFVGIFVTLGFWINYNISDSTSSTKVLANILVFIFSIVLSEVATRISFSKLTKLDLVKKRSSRFLAIGWLAILVVALAPNVSSESSAIISKPNVIMLIIDTLRADRLGCYGYNKDTTPSIDSIAKRGVLFEQAYVQWPSSLPSHASIMTSMYPHLSGAFPNGNHLDPKLETLAKILKANGYRTGAFVTNSLVGNRHNFDLGFDTFIDLADFDYENTTWEMWVHSFSIVRLFDYLSRNDIFTHFALSWLDKNKSGPFFLWVQWLYPHAPYDPNNKFLKRFANNYTGIADGSMEQIELINGKNFRLSEEDQRYYEALYDGEVAYSDYQVKRVIDKLESLDLLENSLLIITSDHGENLYEHPAKYKHHGVYDSSLHIPLILFFPAKLPETKRISEVIESIDIAPTILDILEIPEPAQFQGKSALSLIYGKDPDWNSVAYGMYFGSKQNFFTIRDGDWKIILKTRENRQEFELYHILSDPNEQVNRIEIEPEIADSLKQTLTSWIERNFEDRELVYTPGKIYEDGPEHDNETLNRLRSMGYIK